MAFPTEPTEPIIEIATDATYDAPGDAWDGEPTKVVPSTAVQTQGYAPGTPRPSDYDNWLFSAFAKWLAYFRAFCVELLNRIVSDEWTYPMPKTRTIYLPVSASEGVLNHAADTPWAVVPGVASYAISKSDRARRVWSLTGVVPSGATITRLRALVQPEANHVDPDAMSLRADSFVVSGASITSAFHVGPYYDSGSSGADEWIDSGPITLYAIAGRFIEVSVRSSAEADDDTVLLLEVTFADPGPRNA